MKKNSTWNLKNESDLTTPVYLNLESLWHSWKQGSCSVYRGLPKSNLIKNKPWNQPKHQKNNLQLNMLGIFSAYYSGLDDLFWIPRAQAGIMTLNILCVTGRKEIRENWHKLLQIPLKILHLVFTKRWDSVLVNSEHIFTAKQALRTLWPRSFCFLEVTGKVLHHFVMHWETVFVLQSFFCLVMVLELSA